MDQLQKYFYIEHFEDNMSAQIFCTEAYKNIDIELNEASVLQFIQENKIVYGINQGTLTQLLIKPPLSEFPLPLAEGLPVIHGSNGEIIYMQDFDTEIVKNENWNFRDVMRIPSVKKGQKLATLSLPTKGEDGKNIYGNTVRSHPGKPVTIKPGKNVVFQNKDLSFYATSDGQVSVVGRDIHVHPVFEVNETLSMKTGNLDFVGSIIIHGDVPSGYTVKAAGDIKVFGMVEAATLSAGGSIYISEGLAGLKKGTVTARENIHIGYINQGIVNAGKDLYVEHSILHSECTVKAQVLCQRGNIIGGALSAGERIEAKDIGSRLSTKTEIYLGVNKSVDQNEKKLLTKKKELTNELAKLDMRGKQLIETAENNTRLKIMMLKQKNTTKKTKEQLKAVEEELLQINPYLGNRTTALLIVRQHLYPHVTVAFGKYKRVIKTNHHYVQMKLDQNEIVILGI